MSALGQKRTFNGHLFDHLVGAGEQSGGTAVQEVAALR
jgi:hypothetical protein